MFILAKNYSNHFNLKKNCKISDQKNYKNVIKKISQSFYEKIKINKNAQKFFFVEKKIISLINRKKFHNKKNYQKMFNKKKSLTKMITKKIVKMMQDSLQVTDQ